MVDRNRSSTTLRRWANLLNGSTLLGRALARLHGVPLRPGPHGLWLAPDYPRRFPAPHAGAVCVGDVVLLRPRRIDLSGELTAEGRALLRHEARHAGQWARWGGPFFLLAYGLASAWSWLRTGDAWSRNGFEVAAGLRDAGYRERPPRRRRPPPPSTASR